MRRVAIIQVSDRALFDLIEDTDSRRIHARLSIDFQEVSDGDFVLLERAVREKSYYEGYILVEDKTFSLTTLIEQGREIVAAEDERRKELQKEEALRKQRVAKQKATRESKSLERAIARLEKLKQEQATNNTETE